MSKRYGRQQKRKARAEIERLNRELNRAQYNSDKEYKSHQRTDKERYLLSLELKEAKNLLEENGWYRRLKEIDEMIREICANSILIDPQIYETGNDTHEWRIQKQKDYDFLIKGRHDQAASLVSYETIILRKVEVMVRTHPDELRKHLHVRVGNKDAGYSYLVNDPSVQSPKFIDHIASELSVHLKTR